MKQINWQKFASESLMIIISILLALGVNNCQNHLKDQRSQRESMQNILSEIRENIERLEQTAPYHQEAGQRLRAVADSLADSAEKVTGTAIEISRPYLRWGLSPALLQRTAWDAAVVGNKVELFDFETTKSFSGLYKLQESGVENTWATVAEFSLDRESFDPELSVRNIRILGVYLGELGSQEFYLKEKAEDLLDRYADVVPPRE